MRSIQKCFSMMTVSAAMLMCMIFLGTAFAADYISSVSEPQILYGKKTTAALWAKVIPPEGVVISRVWAEIALPIGECSFLDLSDTNNDRVYEGIYEQFTEEDADYPISFYAQDAENLISVPKDSMVSKREADADDYEQDDAFSQAKSIILNSQTLQQHNFHKSGDTDWVKFYGVAGQHYTVQVDQSSNAIVEIFASDGITKLKWSQDIDPIAGSTILLEWDCSSDGIYYVKIRNYTSDFGTDFKYDLKIYMPFLPLTGRIYGTVKDEACKTPLGDVKIKTSGKGSEITSDNGLYTMEDHPAGSYTLIAEKIGYQEYSYSGSLEESGSSEHNIYLSPLTPQTFSIIIQAGIGGVITGSTSQNISKCGDSTTVTAVPNAGYKFVNWTGTGGFVMTTDNPLIVKNVNIDMTITANFQPITYTVTFQGSGNGSISGTTSQTVNHGGSCSQVTAVPNQGYRFVNWTGTGGFVTTTDNPLIVKNVTTNMTITANFQLIPPVTHTVTFVAGTGGSLIGTTSQTVVSGSSCSQVKAEPNAGYRFVNWTGTGGFITITDNPLTVANVIADMIVTANFAIPGNVNGDNNVGLDDAIMALRIMCEIPLKETFSSKSDVNGDGRIGMEEVIYILQHVAVLR